MKQALVDIEDSRFYEHNGLDVQGTLRALATQPGRRLGAGGRLDAHPAAGQADPAADGDHPGGAAGRRPSRRRRAVPQAARGAAGAGPGGDLLQGRDPHPLPEHRVLRPGRLRHPGRGAEVLQRERRATSTLPQAAMLAGLVQSPAQRRPDHQPGEGAGPAQPGAAADARPRPHHRRRSSPRSRPAGRGRRGRRPAERLHRRRGSAASSAPTCYSYLTGTLGLTRRAARERRPDDPDHAAAGHAERRRPGRAEHPADGRPAGRHLHRRRARHRASPGDERQPPVRLRRKPRVRVGRPQLRRQPGRRARRTRSSPPPPRWSRASRSTTRSPPPTPYTSRVFKKNGGTRGAPYCVGNAGTTRARWTSRALYMSSNTYFVALEDALGSVEEPVRWPRRMGMHFDRRTSDAPTRSSTAEQRVVHPRPDADQPARPGQRLLDARRQRHPVRPDAGHRRSSTATASR